MGKKVRDLTGQTFGKLTVIERAGSDKHGNALWKCQCDCSEKNIITVVSYDLINGHTKSCGCLKIERSTKHGQSQTRLHKIWTDMHTRCRNKNAPNYKRYGAENKTVCEEWKDFSNFYKWSKKTGYKENLTIERINNDKGYSPDNCRWATKKEQANNRRTNHFLTYNGETHTITEWSEITGIKRYTLYYRINKLHWNAEKALTTKRE